MDVIPSTSARAGRAATAFAVAVFAVGALAVVLIAVALAGASPGVVLTISVLMLAMLAVAVAGHFICAGIRDARDRRDHTRRRDQVKTVYGLALTAEQLRELRIPDTAPAHDRYVTGGTRISGGDIRLIWSDGQLHLIDASGADIARASRPLLPAS
jgi:hypothetical protein